MVSKSGNGQIGNCFGAAISSDDCQVILCQNCHDRHADGEVDEDGDRQNPLP